MKPWYKKASIIGIALIIASLSIGMVSAQDENQPDRRRGRGRPGAGQMMEAIMDATGLDREAIAQHMQDGGTLAELIIANGGSVEDVVDAIVANATAQSETFLAELPDRINEALNKTADDFGNDRPNRPGNILRGVLQVVSDATGLDRAAIIEQLQNGGTVADLITANGGSVEDVVNTLVTSATERINQAVADGKMPQERADTILSELPTRIEEALNKTADDFRGRDGDRGFFGDRPNSPDAAGQGNA